MAIHSFAYPPGADTLGGRIVQARAYARLTQTQLEHALGVSRRTLGSWERDKTVPNVMQLVRIAEVTGFPAAWFLDGLTSAGYEGPDTDRLPLAITGVQPTLWDESEPSIDLREQVSGRATVTGFRFERPAA